MATRLAAVVAIVLALVAGFAYAGGWFSPHSLTPARFVDTFEQLNGVHAGFRRNHAKGVGVRGTFSSNGSGVRVSEAVVFRPGEVPVVGRFALGGGMPRAPDMLQTVRSMALRFALPNGEEWRTGMNNIPVFVSSTPEGFRDQMLASAPDPATGKPDPRKVEAFMAKHPETARAIATIKAQPPSAGFADSSYHSLNAFVMTNREGVRTPVRWSMVALEPRGTPSPPTQPNALFDALAARIKNAPLRWRLVLTLGQPGDSTRDATLAWPADREQLDVGTLTLEQVESEESSPARAINFDPLILPAGIAGSDDPLLSARSAAYSASFRRRTAEPTSASAVTGAELAP